LRLNTRLATMQKNYQAQFTKLDTLMSNMNSTSSFLTQQLASLAKSA
jgi:flagellar hook-associated protein 2